MPLTYYVFDLLELDGRDLRKEPLVRRKELLHKLLRSPPEGVATASTSSATETSARQSLPHGP